MTLAAGVVGDGHRAFDADGETDTAPNVITKLLNEYHATVLRQNNVRYVYRRTKTGRRIVLSRGDGVDSGDGLSGMPSARETAVNPVL